MKIHSGFKIFFIGIFVMTFFQCAHIPRPEPAYTIFDQVQMVKVTVKSKSGPKYETFQDEYTYHGNGKLATALSYQSMSAREKKQFKRSYDVYGRLLNLTISKLTSLGGCGHISKTAPKSELLKRIDYYYAGPPKGELYIFDNYEMRYEGHLPYRLKGTNPGNTVKMQKQADEGAGSDALGTTKSVLNVINTLNRLR